MTRAQINQAITKALDLTSSLPRGDRFGALMALKIVAVAAGLTDTTADLEARIEALHIGQI